MGEIAEEIMDGVRCEDCAILINDGASMGYPRRCRECLDEIDGAKRPVRRKRK